MTLRKASLLTVAAALVLAVGLPATFAQAQSDRPREEAPRMSAEEQRERQLKDLAERVAAMRREIEASQRVAAARKEVEANPRAQMGNPPGRILERLQQRRLAEGLAEKPKAPELRADEVRVTINGREIKLGDGKSFILQDGKPVAAPNRQEQERREMRERAERPNPAPARGNPDGAKEGKDGVTFSISGMKPMPPGGGWQAVPNPARAGAPLGRPGNVAVFGEGQRREAREAGAREARERREGGGFRPNPAPMPGANPGPGAPRPPGAPEWRRPMPPPPGAGPVGGPVARGPDAPTPGQPVRPNVAAAGMQQIQQMMGMLRIFREVSFNPETAAMTAIGAIKDESPRRPELAIKVLESTLKKTRTVGLRTAIHMSLKDLYKAQGNEEMVLEHLRDMILENDEALQEHKGDMVRRGGEKDGPPRKAVRRDKDNDDDDDD